MRLMGLLKDESGQDLVEYTLLMAFILLASALLFSGAASSGTNVVWQTTSNTLSNASTAGS